MNVYIVFQLVVDILLFAIIIAFVARDGARKGSSVNLPDIEELRALVHEFDDAIRRSERSARDLDAQIRARHDALEKLNLLRPSDEKKEGDKKMPSYAAPARVEPKEAPLSSASASSSSSEERRRKVKALRAQGVAKEEIARRLSLSQSQVELIIKMAGNAGES